MKFTAHIETIQKDIMGKPKKYIRVFGNYEHGELVEVFIKRINKKALK